MSEAPLVGTLLHEEHELLGATFSVGPLGVMAPDYYGMGEGEPEAFDEACALIDISSMRSLLISGTSAPEFVSTVFTCEVLEIGDIHPSCVLAGDGTVVSCALISRTGDTEYACWTAPETSDKLTDWLDSLARIDANGVRPFADLFVRDVTGKLQTFLLAGPKAPSVLADYLGKAKLPATDKIADLLLDDIPCLVGSVSTGKDAGWLLLVPSPRARSLWRSFLSFEIVRPVGLSALWSRIGLAYPGISRLLDEPGLSATPHELGCDTMLRPDNSFVGARALGLS